MGGSPGLGLTRQPPPLLVECDDEFLDQVRLHELTAEPIHPAILQHRPPDGAAVTAGAMRCCLAAQVISTEQRPSPPTAPEGAPDWTLTELMADPTANARPV